MILFCHLDALLTHGDKIYKRDLILPRVISMDIAYHLHLSVYSNKCQRNSLSFHGSTREGCVYLSSQLVKCKIAGAQCEGNHSLEAKGINNGASRETGQSASPLMSGCQGSVSPPHIRFHMTIYVFTCDLLMPLWDVIQR